MDYTLYMKMKDKVKRRHVDWYAAMRDLEDLKVEQAFWAFKSKHPKMSKNRCAFYILKSNYSTTTIAYYRMFGTWPHKDVWPELLEIYG